MKRILTGLLICALLVSPAAAEETLSMFPAVNDYAAAGYTDVPADSWYAQAARVCYETGLMMGTQKGFEPERTLSVAEVAAIAARIREAIVGDAIPQAEAGQPWYAGCVAYLEGAGVSVPSPEKDATRQEFVELLAAVLPNSYLVAINTITALPDSKDPRVLTFYNAGVLTGSDAAGSFNPGGTLHRHECAALVARVVQPALRKTFSLNTVPEPSAPKDPSEGLTYEEELAQTTALMVNGKTVTMTEFVGWLNQVVYRTDYNLYASSGGSLRLNWETDYGVGDLGEYFKAQAVNDAVRYYVKETQARAYGCEIAQLAQTLTPNPSREVLSAYAQSQDLLAAKHILILTTDPQTKEVRHSDAEALQTAQAVIDGMGQAPSLQQFNNLMAIYNEDPGMVSYPEGYLFSAGEMVSEFESAVRALEMGTYTPEPVKSSYGYHVILRLDPADLTQCKERYQNAVLNTLVDTWMAEATVTTNDAMIATIDAQGCYDQYMKQLAAQQG